MPLPDPQIKKDLNPHIFIPLYFVSFDIEK